MYKLVGVINYIAVVFLNAFTDLGHKIIIQNTIFKVYDGNMQVVLTAIVNALVLLPFILAFSPSGFLADRFPKNKIMSYSAFFAVVITLGITYAYYHGLFILAFIFTFILSLQSAIYAPAKYGYIKELVGVKYLSSGNAAVQATTTVAILGGIIFYTVLFENMYSDALLSESAILEVIAPLGWLLVICSVIEWFFASRLPNKMQKKSVRKFKLKAYLRGEYLFKNIKTVTRKREVLDAIISLSLFWSISQVVLAIFGEYAKDNLGITNTIYVQGVMALAGIGIVVGSIFVAKLSKYFVNVGLAGIGAIGMTLIVFLVPFTLSMSLLAIMFTVFGIFASFLIVPLASRMQLITPNIHLGTVLAGNNFIQNIFMFSFLSLTTIFAYFGMNTKALFYLMTLVGIYLSYRVFRRYYVNSFWSLMQIFAIPRHKYIYHGLENIPTNRAVLLLSNHVSWLDWIILQLPIQRHINYMMEKEIFDWPFFHAFFKKGEAIPVSAKASKDAFAQAHKRLKQGRVVGLFPEGAISRDGELGTFHRGYELISKDYDGMIVPVYIDGVFGSLFSRYKGNKKRSLLKRREIHVYFAQAISKETKASEVQEIIQKMKDKYEVK